MSMTKFENLQCKFVPLDWRINSMISFTSVGKANTVYPYCFEREGTSSFLLLYTKGGQGRLKYKDKEYLLEKGDLFFIDCCEYQQYAAVSEKWDFVFLHTEYNMITEFYNAITSSGENAVVHYPAFLNECWEKIEECFTNPHDGGYEKASITILTLLFNLIAVRKTSIPENIRRAAEYIKENYTDISSIDGLAKLAALSKYHFIRSFKKYYNATPHEFVVLCRVNAAKSMLVGSDKDMEKISSGCGFSTPAAFSQSFKRITGMSPAAYRKQNKVL